MRAAVPEKLEHLDIIAINSSRLVDTRVMLAFNKSFRMYPACEYKQDRENQ
jgi:hypothetical protein